MIQVCQKTSCERYKQVLDFLLQILCENVQKSKHALPLFVRMFSSLKVSGVSKANMESLS